MTQLGGRRDLEAVDLHPLRVDPAHDVANGPILARCIERLDHDDDAVPCLGCQSLLVLGEQRDAVVQQVFAVVLLLDAPLEAGVEVLRELDLRARCDAEGLDEPGDAAGRGAGTHAPHLPHAARRNESAGVWVRGRMRMGRRPAMSVARTDRAVVPAAAARRDRVWLRSGACSTAPRMSASAAHVLVFQPSSRTLSSSNTSSTPSILRASATAARRWAKLPTVPRSVTTSPSASTAISWASLTRGSSSSLARISLSMVTSVMVIPPWELTPRGWARSRALPRTNRRSPHTR